MEQFEVIRLLKRDVAATLGREHESVVTDFANLIDWINDPHDYEQKVADDVQQYFHDTFVDTSWPKCPRHPNHPMWYRDGDWWCEQDRVTIAKLGELGSIASAEE